MTIQRGAPIQAAMSPASIPPNGPSPWKESVWMLTTRPMISGGVFACTSV